MRAHGRGRARAQLAFLEACETVEDHLQTAKDVHAENPTAETLAAKREAMATMHETRRWIRAVDGIARAKRDLKTYAGATDEKGLRRLAAARDALERIPREHGDLIAAMEELGATSTSGQPPADPVPGGSVEVTPKPVRTTSRVGRPGGGA